jgi:protein SCO1/2
MKPRLLLSVLAIGVAAALAGALLARALSQPPTVALAAGTWLPRAQAVSDFHLRDLAGREFGRADLTGHPSLLFFGFTNCPDVCPTTLAALAQVQRQPPLPDARVIFVTIDPERDSAANLKVYLGAFDHDFIGLRGDAQSLAPLLKSLSAIAVRQPLPGGGYTMDHSATLYLLDSHARLAAVFSPPYSPSALGADLRRIQQTHRL